MLREYGGEWSAVSELPTGPLLHEIHRGVTLWGSGRATLLALMGTGRWKRIWIPSYMCREVKDALRAFTCATYLDHPLLEPAGLPEKTVPGDLVLRVNYFGLRGADEAERSRGDVVEDHSHDPVGPWARASRATFGMASLRKTFPTPDGGALWSPSGAGVPAEIDATLAHLAAADARREAMEQKALYLRGQPVERAAMRTLFAAGEARIGTLSGIHPETRETVLACSPVELAARSRRSRDVLAAATPWAVPAKGDPFGLVLDLKTHRRRERVLRALIDEGVHPSVLWPLSFFTAGAAKTASKRLLFVPSDFRYSPRDVETVAEILRGIAEREA